MGNKIRACSKNVYGFFVVEIVVAFVLLGACVFLLNNDFLSEFSSMGNVVRSNRNAHTKAMAANYKYKVDNATTLSSAYKKKEEKPEKHNRDYVSLVDDSELALDEIAEMDENFQAHTHRIGCYFFCRNESKMFMTF